MSYFDEGNRLTQDKCALLSKEVGNTSISDYYLFNAYTSCKCTDELLDFSLENPNLRFKNGYGNVNSCSVDESTEIRGQRLTHYRGRDQLCTRWDQAVPDYGRGGFIPSVDSRLKLSEDTSYIKDCDIVTEKNFDRFIPLVDNLASCIQDPHNIVLPFARGGSSTRDYIRDDSYLKKCGFENDGKMWKKKE